ncbi:hypothetical protein FPL11_05595 [Spiribacter aquaticus]|uniref:Hint domain-containing protein n=1 Tax=Spiribacter aquaticus TaxID=1935996 RepID=A0A557RK48_9GAMM|nr:MULTISPECIES: hypothetical protein [Spiribacter]KAF0279936.1 hypothetical protein BA897_04150 [Spiribacter roseus]TVO65539.1 hypothetical protein FPL11_05595 [Spiribacter aquaticus]
MDVRQGLLKGIDCGSGATGAVGGGMTGGSNGSMTGGGGMCFHPDTPVCLADGSTVRVGDVRIGDRLADGSSVQMTLEFLTDDLYQVGNVWVSGSHAVYEQGEWKRVRDAAGATRLAVSRQRVINLVTDTHRIQAGGKLFADYLEVGGAFRQSIWTNMVAKYGGVNHAMKAKASVA